MQVTHERKGHHKIVSINHTDLTNTLRKGLVIEPQLQMEGKDHRYLYTCSLVFDPS